MWFNTSPTKWEGFWLKPRLHWPTQEISSWIPHYPGVLMKYHCISKMQTKLIFLKQTILYEYIIWGSFQMARWRLAYPPSCFAGSDVKSISNRTWWEEKTSLNRYSAVLSLWEGKQHSNGLHSGRALVHLLTHLSDSNSLRTIYFS